MNAKQSIADIRKDYKLKSLLEEEVKANPIDQFAVWWDDAVNSMVDEINAMTLATATADGYPSARIVLLKGFIAEGFLFFTNYQSRKGVEMEKNPRAALVFFWKELERQVRIEGTIEKINASDSDLYFQSRPMGSRIGAWASPQSTPIAGRHVIEDNVAKYSSQFAQGEVPRPPHWGGYLLKPVHIEFWQGRSSRLHDRIVYTKIGEDWRIDRLAP